MGRVWRRSGKELLELEWGGYFGDKDVTTITDADMHAYFEHRIKSLLASRQNDGDVGQRKWIASETTVNLSTLQWELRLLRSLFRKAYNQKLVPRPLMFDIPLRRHPNVHSLPTNTIMIYHL